MSSEMEVCDDLLNYSTCIRADAELWSDGIAEGKCVVLVCVCVCAASQSRSSCTLYG